MTGRVKWSRRSPDSRAHRAVSHLLVGALVVVVLTVVLLWVSAVRRLVAAGDVAEAGALVVLALVGGWASVAYLVPVLSDPAVRERILDDPIVEDLSPPWVVVGAAPFAVLVAAVVALGVQPQFVLFVGLVPLLLYASLLRSEGAVDPTGPTVETSERAAPVDGLTGYRTLQVGGTVLVWLSYARGRGGLNAPHLLVVPASDAPDVRRALDAIADPDADPEPVDPGERRAVTAAGVVCLAGAGAAVLLPQVIDVPMAVGVAAAPFGFLGLLFLASAWLE